MNSHTCLICDSQRILNQDGFCPSCEWVVRADVCVGLRDLREYLGKVARFEAWCAARKVTA